MADKRRPTPPRRLPKESDIRKGGGGWQKPVKPPAQENHPPSGLPPKKSS